MVAFNKPEAGAALQILDSYFVMRNDRVTSAEIERMLDNCGIVFGHCLSIFIELKRFDVLIA